MTRARFLLLGLLMLTPAAVRGQDCVEDVLCVIAEERNDAVYFYVDNRLPEALIVIFDVESENMTADVNFPHLGTYAGRQETRAFTLRPRSRRAQWGYSYSFRWRRVVNTLGCQDDVFCIVAEEHDDYIEVFVHNRQPIDVTIELEVELDHTTSGVKMPHSATYPGNRRTSAFRLERVKRDLAVGYSYGYKWLYGRLGARHDDTFAYTLPYAPGKSYAVMQGYNGRFSHDGKHAIDWDMPERTPVHAARGGLVMAIETGYTEGGLDERLKTRANYIRIQHDDGTIGNYVHLAPNGAFVKVGQRVRQGQVIGVSGNTGYSSGPHLHFEVYTITSDLGHQTIPVRFQVDGRQPVILKEGRTYTASLR